MEKETKTYTPEELSELCDKYYQMGYEKGYAEGYDEGEEIGWLEGYWA